MLYWLPIQVTGARGAVLSTPMKLAVAVEVQVLSPPSPNRSLGIQAWAKKLGENRNKIVNRVKFARGLLTFTEKS